MGIVGWSCTLLGVLFVALKLTGHIAWGWAIVTMPFWLPFALALVVIAIFGLVVLAAR